jgi:YggL 50S ribosome-binding protein
VSRNDHGHTFALKCRIAEGIGAPQRELLLRSLAQTVRERGLALFGGTGQELSFVVVRAENDVRADDRRALAEWALTRSELADYRIGPLLASPHHDAGDETD